MSYELKAIGASMGKWGDGIFENDWAAEYRATILNRLIGDIENLSVASVDLSPTQLTQILAALEMMRVLAINCDAASNLPNKTILWDWRTHYRNEMSKYLNTDYVLNETEQAIFNTLTQLAKPMDGSQYGTPKRSTE